MIDVNAENLPWILIGTLLAALVAVFYAMLRGNLLSGTVAARMMESTEKRAEIAEAGVVANTRSIETLVGSMEKLMVLAENQDRVLTVLGDRAGRNPPQGRGGGR